MTCNTCKGFGYLLTAPSTCSAGGESVPCPVCTPKVASDTGAGLAEKYADMEIGERAVAMADDRVGDPWELLGFFREKLRQSKHNAERAKAAAIDLAIKNRDLRKATPIEATDGEARYLIRKGGYYYRPNAQGYTSHKAEAGRYTLVEAVRHSHPNGPDGPRDGMDYVLADATDGATGGGEECADCKGTGDNPTPRRWPGPYCPTCEGSGRLATTPGGDLLEQAATVADDIWGEGPSGSYDNGATADGWNMACSEIAKRIRALKPAGDGGEA